jgi:predicted deacylase
MCEAWSEGLEDNTPNASAEVKGEFTTLCSMMDAIPKGNRLVLTYVPGKGTTVEINGKVKGTLPGKATADAIVSTWIGPKPGPGDDFKAAVLGH